MADNRNQRFAPQRARRLQEALARKAAETVAPAELFGRMTDADPQAREAEELRQAAQPYRTKLHRELVALRRELEAPHVTPTAARLAREQRDF